MNYFIKSHYLFDTEQATTYAGLLEVKDGYIASIRKASEETPLEELVNAVPTDALLYDYSQQMVIPSFIDAHVHYFLSTLLHAGTLNRISGNTPTIVAEQVGKLPIASGWRLGMGWYMSDFPQHQQPSKEILDQYTGQIPAIVLSGDAHCVWFNSAALHYLNITPETVRRDLGGTIGENNGALTGVFFEAIAIYYIGQVLRLFQGSFQTDSLNYMRHLNQMGITAVGDVALTGESPDDIVYPELYEKIIDQATVRINFFPAMREQLEPLQELYTKHQHPLLQMGGVKQFFDGVTSSHTAYLKQPYPNPFYEGDVGGPLIPVTLMRKLIHLAAKSDWPMRIHAIGDRAIQLTLEYFKEAQTFSPLSETKYNTIEHLEVMDFDDLPLTTQSNLVLSVQPSHLLVGYETLEDEIGAQRVAHMFPFATFKKVGGTLAFGTDTPVVKNITPLQSIYFAVARQTLEGKPEHALMPDERMSIADALVAHTAGAAKALSRSDIGQLRVGMRADIAVLSRNILPLQAQELLDTTISATFIDGKLVYVSVE